MDSEIQQFKSIQAKVLPPYEIKKLFQAFEGDRDRALFTICLYTGCCITAFIRVIFTLRKANTKEKQETRQILVNSVLKSYLETY